MILLYFNESIIIVKYDNFCDFALIISALRDVFNGRRRLWDLRIR